MVPETARLGMADALRVAVVVVVVICRDVRAGAGVLDAVIVMTEEGAYSLSLLLLV